MTIDQYLENIAKRFKTGISREHSYRGDLQNLLESLLPDVMITNEPARVEYGAPDYILTRGNIPVSFIEAKDIGDPDLEGKKKHKEQFDRYKATHDPFIFTDYLDFHLYLDGDFITSIKIADIENGNIISNPDKFDEFRDLIKDFATQRGQTIRSASKLSKMMAGKARLLATIIQKAIESDEEEGQVNEAANNSLREQMEAFKDVLIHDIDAKEFADIYAQTIAYGMFAARLHDPTLGSFSRYEAAELIPRTNPFLRRLFQYIAGYDLDDRIAWVVDALADIFRATDVAKLMEDFGKSTQQNDPVIHFYETFLAEFDPALRKSRGVWYTPEPVVNFIVQAVDDILKDEFGLKDGLADTTKTTVTVKTDVKDKRKSDGYKEEEREVHRVQILDPAAGTGTFLAEVIKQIHTNFEGQEGLWPSYVENDLIPRLNGFELLMASYAMAHLKLDILLKETGYNREASQRFRVYLTNSLEEHHPDTGTLFAHWLSEEANQANHVKRDTPVMVVMGNPPYSVSSTNKGPWIKSLMEDYKKNLNERNINPLSDDYLKFIRFGEYFIEKNTEGILAYISNNSFVDGIIHRQVRKHLLKSFDKIFILDLHGSSTKKEKTPEGKQDQNVFDIRQGVSINIFIKSSQKRKDEFGDVFHSDLWGKRTHKYDFLSKNSLKDRNWNQVEVKEPNFFFIPKNYEIRETYKQGFSTDDLFKDGSTGIKTERDSLTIHYSQKELLDFKKELISTEVEEFRKKKNERKDGRDWKLAKAKDDLVQNNPEHIKLIYRPFDIRHTYYTGNTKGFHAYPRDTITQHFVDKKNLGLVHLRQNYEDEKYIVMLTNLMTEKGSMVCGNYYISPLYLYPEEGGQQTLDGKLERTPNLDVEIVQEIAGGLGLRFVPELPTPSGKAGHPSGEGTKEREAFAPIDLLDYIYAVLHSPTYREKYKEFLKIDFPRVPYPTDTEIFWQLVELGGELRQIHLLEHPVVDNFITTYPEAGSNEITKRLTKNEPGFIPYTKDGDHPSKQMESTSRVASISAATPTEHRYPDERLGKIQINNKQYFGRVPEKAWNFYIGGYQPAEKWLKDRRGRELTVEEIQHYQKIIVALMETDRIMKEIDKIEIE